MQAGAVGNALLLAKTRLQEENSELRALLHTREEEQQQQQQQRGREKEKEQEDSSPGTQDPRELLARVKTLQRHLLEAEALNESLQREVGEREKELQQGRVA